MWSPAGGWWANPRHWKRNTALGYAFIGTCLMFTFRYSAANEVRGVRAGVRGAPPLHFPPFFSPFSPPSVLPGEWLTVCARAHVHRGDRCRQRSTFRRSTGPSTPPPTTRAWPKGGIACARACLVCSSRSNKNSLASITRCGPRDLRTAPLAACASRVRATALKSSLRVTYELRDDQA